MASMNYNCSSQANKAPNAWEGNVKQADCENGPYGNGSTKKSTNYYAQAQSAHPSPMDNIVQTSPTQSTRSELTIHKEEHITEKTEVGSLNNPNYVSGPSQPNQVGLVVHKEEHMLEKVEQSWANKPTQHGLGIYEEDDMLGKMDSNLGNKPTKLSRSMSATHYGQQMYKDQYDGAYNYSENGIESAWNAKPTKYMDSNQLSSMHTKNNGIEVQKEDHMIRKFESNSVNNEANLFGQSMYKDHEEVYNYSEGGVEQAWVAKPTNYLRPIRTNDTALGVRKEDHMIGKIDQSWANSPTKLTNPQNNYSNLSMYKEDPRMGKMGYGPNSPTNYSSSIQNDNLGHKMYEEHKVANSDHKMAYPSTQLSGPVVRGNQYGQSMYGSNGTNGSWANQPIGYPARTNTSRAAQNGYGPSQVNHSAYGTTPNGYGSDQVNYSSYGATPNGYGAGQVNYSAYDTPQNGYGLGQANHSTNNKAQNGYGSSQVNHSAYGVAQNGYDVGEVNYSPHRVAQNGYGPPQVNHSAHGATKNGYGGAQVHYSPYGPAQNGYVSAQVNLPSRGQAQSSYGSGQVKYSAYGAAQNEFGSDQLNNHSNYGLTQNGYGTGHGTYNYQDHEKADESVHDILDEILAKYGSTRPIMLVVGKEALEPKGLIHIWAEIKVIIMGR